MSKDDLISMIRKLEEQLQTQAMARESYERKIEEVKQENVDLRARLAISTGVSNLQFSTVSALSCILQGKSNTLILHRQ